MAKKKSIFGVNNFVKKQEEKDQVDTQSHLTNQNKECIKQNIKDKEKYNG